MSTDHLNRTWLGPNTAVLDDIPAQDAPDRPPFVLTLDQLFTATKLSMNARALHRCQVLLRRYPELLTPVPPPPQ